MTTLVNFNDTVRRSVCFAMAACIVALGLTLGSMGADASFAAQYEQAAGANVSIMQVASL